MRHPPPPDFNRCLAAYVPKELDRNTPSVPSAHASRMRPVTLSDTSCKLLVKAVNATLARVTRAVVHPAQRGFTTGRGLLTNAFEALALVHLSRSLIDAGLAVVLFDIRTAFLSVSWE